MAMPAMMTARRFALTATGVGAAAGCMGTWFEMSHGVVCIPVLTVPPLMLSQQMAVGSTLFGVALRQTLSAGLYALDPRSSAADGLSLYDLVDVPAAAAMAVSGTVTALSSAVLSTKITQRSLHKCNGLFLMVVSLFLHWRSSLASEPDVDEQDLAQAAQVMRMSSGAAEAAQPGAQPGTFGPLRPGDLTAMSEAERVSATPQTSLEELSRFIVLGAVSGVVLGLFGVGPAWMLAPLVDRTAPGASFFNVDTRQEVGPDAEGEAQGSIMAPRLQIGSAGCDDRTRRTCCLAMLPPCLAAAWRHFSLGHVQDPQIIAYPLAAGAVAGSLFAGQVLADVPCQSEFKTSLSVVLFSYGAWSFFKPGR